MAETFEQVCAMIALAGWLFCVILVISKMWRDSQEEPCGYPAHHRRHRRRYL